VVTIFIFGTGDIKNFALSLIVGVVVGTYSTIFIASPIVLGWSRLVDRRRKRRDVQLYGRQAAAPASQVQREQASQQEIAQQESGPEAGREQPREVGPRAPVHVTRVQPSKKKKKKKKH
jgi:preprotein translocase subunit SecF